MMAATSFHSCLDCGHSWESYGVVVYGPPCPRCGIKNHDFLMKNAPQYKKSFNKMKDRFHTALRRQDSIFQKN